MKIAAWMKFNFALCVALMLVLAGGPTVVLAQDSPSHELTAAEIFKKAKEAYAALSTYSDEGRVVGIINGETITRAFTERLSRPNLYRVEWQQSVSSSPKGPGAGGAGAVWSAGDGDFLEAGGGAIRQVDLQKALIAAVPLGGDVTLPEAFFKTLGSAYCCLWGYKRQPDEKVGGVDCYVFKGGPTKEPTTTMWIGKQDFLLRQRRLVTSAEAMQTVMDQAAKANPGVSQLKIKQQDSTITETHSNIVVNQKLAAADFVP
jgi:outer membrane lipoprotein-sorting protein